MKKLTIAVIVGLATLSTNVFATIDTPVEFDTLILYNQGALDAYAGDLERRVNYVETRTHQTHDKSRSNIKVNTLKVKQ